MLRNMRPLTYARPPRPGGTGGSSSGSREWLGREGTGVEGKEERGGRGREGEGRGRKRRECLTPPAKIWQIEPWSSPVVMSLYPSWTLSTLNVNVQVRYANCMLSSKVKVAMQLRHEKRYIHCMVWWNVYKALHSKFPAESVSERIFKIG